MTSGTSYPQHPSIFQGSSSYLQTGDPSQLGEDEPHSNPIPQGALISNSSPYAMTQTSNELAVQPYSHAHNGHHLAQLPVLGGQNMAVQPNPVFNEMMGMMQATFQATTDLQKEFSASTEAKKALEEKFNVNIEATRELKEEVNKLRADKNLGEQKEELQRRLTTAENQCTEWYDRSEFWHKRTFAYIKECYEKDNVIRDQHTEWMETVKQQQDTTLLTFAEPTTSSDQLKANIKNASILLAHIPIQAASIGRATLPDFAFSDDPARFILQTSVFDENRLPGHWEHYKERKLWTNRASTYEFLVIVARKQMEDNPVMVNHARIYFRGARKDKDHSHMNLLKPKDVNRWLAKVHEDGSCDISNAAVLPVLKVIVVPEWRMYDFIVETA